MKFKSFIFLVLLFLTICSISSIHADTFVIGNSSFSLPDGYTLVEKDNQTVLYNDEYGITMYNVR